MLCSNYDFFLKLNPYRNFNGRSQTGFAVPQASLRNGLRCSANKAYIRPTWKRSNLHVLLKAFVKKIIIDGLNKQARGLIFDWMGNQYKVAATREVILSAGAISSPQLLMVSGVGPRKQLLHNRIDVIQDLPGVGANLQDHISATGSIYLIDNTITGDRLSFIVPEMLNARSVAKFIYEQNGFFYAVPIAEVMGFWHSKYQDPKTDWPDVQYFMISYAYAADGGIISRRGSALTFQNYAQSFEPILYHDSFQIVPLLMRPKSRGRLEIISSDIRVQPKIYANYFDHPLDMAIMVSAIDYNFF